MAKKKNIFDIIPDVNKEEEGKNVIPNVAENDVKILDKKKESIENSQPNSNKKTRATKNEKIVNELLEILDYNTTSEPGNTYFNFTINKDVLGKYRLLANVINFKKGKSLGKNEIMSKILEHYLENNVDALMSELTK